MRVCCCSLAGTAACFTCSNRPVAYQDWTMPSPFHPFPFPPPIPQWNAPGTGDASTPAPKKTTVEEYDKNGKLIRRIITTQE